MRIPVLVTLLLIDSSASALDKSMVIDIEKSWHEGSSQLSRLSARLDMSGSVADNSAFTAIIRGQIIGPDDFEPGIPDQDFVSPASQRFYLNSSTELELRELYVDVDFDNAALRLGKQQVVWGQADGLKLLDVVNPQEFRRFILDDFDDSRIPVWMVNLEMFLPVGDLQFLWIPDTSMHNLPESGALFEITAPFVNIPSNVPIQYEAVDRPDNGFTDADAGLRLSMFTHGWDITLNYLYHYDDLPVVRSQLTSEGILFSPGFERTHTIGGSASGAFSDFIVRAEIVFNSDKYLNIKESGSIDARGVGSTREFGYVLGLDWRGLTNTFASIQLFESYLLDDEEFLRDGVDTHLTFLLNRSFLNESLAIELLSINHMNDQDRLLRLSAEYEITSNTTVKVYADVFTGEADELFGQFDERDQVGIKLTVGFQ